MRALEFMLFSSVAVHEFKVRISLHTELQTMYSLAFFFAFEMICLQRKGATHENAWFKVKVFEC